MTSTPPPQSPGRPVAQVIRPLRDLTAYALVAAPALWLFVAVIRLIPSGVGQDFLTRVQNSFYAFVNLEQVALPLLAVLLATMVQPMHKHARLITLVALIEYAATAFFAIVFGFLIALVKIADWSARVAFEELLVRVAWLAVFAAAAYAVFLIWRGLFNIPKPTPPPGMYGQPQQWQQQYGQPGYPQPGQPGFPPAAGYPGYAQPGGPAQPGMTQPGMTQPAQPGVTQPHGQPAGPTQPLHPAGYPQPGQWGQPPAAPGWGAPTSAPPAFTAPASPPPSFAQPGSPSPAFVQPGSPSPAFSAPDSAAPTAPVSAQPASGGAPGTPPGPFVPAPGHPPAPGPHGQPQPGFADPTQMIPSREDDDADRTRIVGDDQPPRA